LLPCELESWRELIRDPIEFRFMPGTLSDDIISRV
jgi:hypothetical protein